MGLYQQDTEIEILKKVIQNLDNKIVIDVGAAKGDFFEFYLSAGSEKIYAFEPYPKNFAGLKKKFQKDTRIQCFPYALGDIEGEKEFHIAVDPASEEEYEYHHTLVDFEDTETVKWEKKITVECKTLGGLVQSGTIPKNVGILKIDTEGYDYFVIKGIGDLDSDVIMVEFWDDDHPLLQAQPWALDELVRNLALRGYSNFVMIKRNDEFEFYLLNSADSQKGDWGNIIFFHDRVFKSVAPEIYPVFSQMQTELFNQAQLFKSAANERIKIIQEMEAQLQERLPVFEDLSLQAEERAKVIADLKQQAENRAEVIADLKQQVEERADVIADLKQQTEERNRVINDLKEREKARTQVIGDLKKEAEKRSSLIEDLRGKTEEYVSEIENLNSISYQHEEIIADLKSDMKGVRKEKESLDSQVETMGLALGEIEEELGHRNEEIEEKEQVLQTFHQELLQKEDVIQSFRNSLFYWSFHGPFSRLTILRALIRRVYNFRVNFRNRFKPRLGVLVHHPPRKLELPQRYKNSPGGIRESDPLISIVTPSYNQGRFIGRTISSVLGQNYANLEYIIQDGASNDDTFEVVDCFQDHRITFNSTPDDGQAHAINMGFSKSEGDIMGYLNSDDILLPGVLPFIANYFHRHPDVDVIYGHRIIINEEDMEIGRWILPPHKNKTLYYADFIPQETLFWRRKIWDFVGGKVDQSFAFAMDWDLIMRFIEGGAKIVRVPRFLGGFRVHGSQKTTLDLNDIGLREMDKVRKRYLGHTPDWKEINKNIKWYLRSSVFYHFLFRLKIAKY